MTELTRRIALGCLFPSIAEYLLLSGCGTLVARCTISDVVFERYNPNLDVCSFLQVRDYLCCPVGDSNKKPKPELPKKGDNSLCATHRIQNSDDYNGLAEKFGITIADIEKWNRGKTCVWSGCKNIVGHKVLRSCCSETSDYDLALFPKPSWSNNS